MLEAFLAQYAGRAVSLLESFGRRADLDPAKKFFLYLPWHDVHAPLQAPSRFQYPAHAHFNDSYAPRLMLNAMVRALDEGMRNVTDTIKAAGLWSETLIVWSAGAPLPAHNLLHSCYAAACIETRHRRQRRMAASMGKQ